MTDFASRYAAAKARTRHARTSDFANDFDFALDDFQIESCHAIEDGYGVLVAAPTGAGKTIVGQFATFLALEQGVKCFYTTPIKALSNQKFQELGESYGVAQVGLLTGDTAINSDAPIVVMTTEVLRNMIYAQSETLDNLGFVVMDEVHYLADKFRGAVWEEILIHLPERVQVISLSATVSNAEEFGEWLNAVRGDTKVVVSEHRPVPLYQHVLMGNRLLDLFTESGSVNPEILRLEKDSVRRMRTFKQQQWRGSDRNSLADSRLSKPEIIEKLDRSDYLPAIFFIFSRVGCESAVQQCVRAGLTLTTPHEREEIRTVIKEKTSHLPPDDYDILNYHQWVDSLQRGIAAHHAGLLPMFKETVEFLFQRGLIQIVFATETLALGINMPAHTVVLEKLSKWNGESHVSITPGEYTQLTGRAGRRGIDIEGHAVVLWNNTVDSGIAAGLASTRTYPLKSSFVPTYNMSANLVSRFGYDRARKSLAASFAQFQADRSVVGLSQQIQKNSRLAIQLIEEHPCHMGDFNEFMAIRRAIKECERSLSERHIKKRTRSQGNAQNISEINRTLDNLKRQIREHPCYSCPDREQHARQYEKSDRLDRENIALRQRLESRTLVIPRIFDRVTAVLQSLGYIDGELLTAKGLTLTKIFSERDLLIAELISHGIMAELPAAELVALLSACVYEGRGDVQYSPKIPRTLEEPLEELVRIWSALSLREEENGVTPLKEPALDFVWPAYRWANGHSLSSILRGSELSIGDFVRSIRQIIDLLGQLLAALPGEAAKINEAIKRIDRGIVTFAGVVL